MRQAALTCIDDPLALIDSRPVTVTAVWQRALESIHCGTADPVTVVYPSWWSSARVGVVTAAARGAVGHVEVRPRRWVLSHGVPTQALIVEITEAFVVVTGAEVVVESCRRDQSQVADAVVRSVLAMVADHTVTVLVDAPATVCGAGALAANIARTMVNERGPTVVVVDDLYFRRVVAELKSSTAHDSDPAPPRRWLPATIVVTAAIAVSAGAWRHHRETPVSPGFPTTVASEGAVAVEVPTAWTMRRVVSGPGSARLQFTSPADAEEALHVTQSRVASPSLDATADFFRRAIDAAPRGVFVDFNPADRSAGRTVVTYREVRAGHDIRWTVWVDKSIRISIGCQGHRGRDRAVDAVCDRAVRSARALD